MAAGLGSVVESQPLDDVTAIIAIVAAVAGAPASFAELARTLTASVGAKLPAFAVPSDGESLYAAADAIEIAVLAALGSR